MHGLDIYEMRDLERPPKQVLEHLETGLMLFKDWCDYVDEPLGKNHVRVIKARPQDTVTGVQATAMAVPVHYAAEERVAGALARLGKSAAAKMITDLLPQTPQIRSGDLGEIYATEWINTDSGYQAPIKRLRWKDHRNMAMRGDDVIGMIIDPATQRLRFLKTEAKSRIDLSARTLEEARSGLDKDGGLPSSHALSYISARLMELGSDGKLVDAIDEALYRHGIPPENVKHLLFTFSGNSPQALLTQALQAYRREIERLLRDSVLKVTISSPTLAQGLNLAATAVVMHSLYRHGEKIKVSEFKNVIGRAGRAYIDVEGVVLFPIFEAGNKKRHDEWVELIEDLGAREMESGLIQLILSLLTRMHARLGGELNELIDYVVNSAAAWSFPEVANENTDKRERALKQWDRYIATLDTAILGLIGEADVPDDQIEPTLDNILQSSLWQRRLLRVDDASREAYRATLLTRSRFVWANSTTATRRGYYLAGLGLQAGHALDAVAGEANDLLIQANASILESDYEAAVAAITGIAERVFTFYPFEPDPFPDNWRDILRCWLLGQPLAAIIAGQEGDALQFIEGGLVYRLPWAMEALRVRAAANGDVVGVLGLPLEDYELGLAVPAVETGTMHRSASILIQAGFSSRLAAIKAVIDTSATFTTGAELRAWLHSPGLAAFSAQPNWPTSETRGLWLDFIREFAPRDNRIWARRDYIGTVQWFAKPAPPGTPVALYHRDGQPLVLAPDGHAIGLLKHALNPNRRGLMRATVAPHAALLDLSYLGPDDLWAAEA
jgi:hypothetical protein